MRSLLALSLLYSAIALNIYGCAARVAYVPSDATGETQAVKILERVVMEQPPKHRPVEVAVTPDYLSYGKDVVLKSKGVLGIPNGGSVSVSSKSRIYFDSISDIRLYHKRKWFIIDVFSKEPREHHRFYTSNQRKAEQFVDSLNLFISKSSDFAG